MAVAVPVRANNSQKNKRARITGFCDGPREEMCPKAVAAAPETGVHSVVSGSGPRAVYCSGDSLASRTNLPGYCPGPPSD